MRLACPYKSTNLECIRTPQNTGQEPFKVQGQLGEKNIADLIRELSSNKSNGLLRLTNGKQIKAVFFDSGNPVFAISNLTTDQLEHKLIKEGFTTESHIAQAKQRVDKANQIGKAIGRNGSPERRRDAANWFSDQAMAIILSMFEWTQGEFVFDERIRASHDVTIDTSAADLILTGARHVAGIPAIAETIAPSDGMVVRTRAAAQGDTGRLIPIESYVLSRIEAPTAISEVGSLSGISEEDAGRAVCALIAAGLLKVQQEEQGAQTCC